MEKTINNPYKIRKKNTEFDKIKPLSIESDKRKSDVPFTTIFDVMKCFSKVHSPIESELSPDFILSPFSDNEKNYIFEQIKDAQIVKDLFDDWDNNTAKSIHKFLTYQTQIMGVLNRNTENNPMLKAFLKIKEENENGFNKFIDEIKKRTSTKTDNEDKIDFTD